VSGARGSHTGSADWINTCRPRHCPACRTAGTASFLGRTVPSVVSASVSARTRRRVSGPVPSLPKPNVSPSGLISCSTGLRLARAGPMWMLTDSSRPSVARRCPSMLSAAGPVILTRSRSSTLDAPVRSAATTASRLSRAVRDCGSAYRRTAAAATRRDVFGTSSRGRRASGTTRYSAIGSPGPPAVSHGAG
jgi:hypothetical protein